MRIATTAQMKELDRIAIEERGIPSLQLMENAAAAVTRAVLALPGGVRRVCVLCGPGNNGGDGIAAARLLLAAGVQVQAWLVGDSGRMTPDARAMQQRLQAAGGCLLPFSAQAFTLAAPAPGSGFDAVVDALFGVGLARPLQGDFLAAVQAVNASGLPVVSCDIPSGVQGDTGARLGAAVQAAPSRACCRGRAGPVPGACWWRISAFRPMCCRRMSRQKEQPLCTERLRAVGGTQ